MQIRKTITIGAVLMALSAGIALAHPIGSGSDAYWGEGYYGFENADSPKDREKELRAEAGHFHRFPSGEPHFEGFCEAINLDLECKYVIDWEGNEKSCRANGRDGTRLAYCGWS